MVSSPFLGYFIDKFGKRVIIIGISSLLLIIAFSLSMFLPSNNNPEIKDISELYVLILVGVAYSIYAAALWGSIPYVVDP
jgi:MFS family permease